MRDLKQLIQNITPASSRWKAQAEARTARLVMPPRALGRLHPIVEQLCAIDETLSPDISRRAFVVMAADHGIAAEGVSAFPQAVTGEMIRCFLNGGAGINVLARHAGADVFVVDAGIVPDLDPTGLPGADHFRVRKVGRGTANFARGPAMSRQEARAAVLVGWAEATQLIDEGYRLLGTGDMGIANTTAATAVGVVLTGCSLEEMVGRGTGIDDAGLQRKRAAIEKGIRLNRPDPGDGLDVLAKVGGFEIGAIAGLILAAAAARRPVVIDGLISTAGALVAWALCPTVTDYLFAGHCGQEPGHRHMLARLGLEPILNLGLRLGEGTGGALALPVMDAALRIFSEMHTFEEAGVSGPA
ncbi:MAG: nicotinate-nucleotide--dimethylbenzimidazole phosphoribosyltransferase [Deltaproteobacteria bacterium]|nr:nicotinate-nucleotide--dimethylbenzimidazole phosphoribosyltransferase [Deltaproteobacteria bacterium]RLB97905.1 MAG: nicotinate-nucleotide--dimethylbenzimidazole phosphoribosyltransferase [Deltaproteobacteria bacterium]